MKREKKILVETLQKQSKFSCEEVEVAGGTKSSK